jgi:hypothetical protein
MTVCLDTNTFLFVVTEDAHFAALKSAGHKPQPITPKEFIRRHLVAK